MAKVRDLTVRPQSGAEATAFATWAFGGKATSSTPSTGRKPKVGDWVKIKKGAKWYNGARIDGWVFDHEWKVVEVRGNRAVVNQSRSGGYRIMSPVHVDNLVGGTGRGSSSSGALSESTVDHYFVRWSYDSGNGIWFVGREDSSLKVRQSTYSPPENALRIRCAVKPISKKHKVNGKERSYWSGDWSYAYYTVSQFPPETPAVPAVTLDGLSLKASIENIADARTDQVQFQVYRGEKLHKSGTAEVKTARASFAATVTAGGEYRARARAVNIVSTGRNYSPWSDYSAPQLSQPAAPSGALTARAMSGTAVRLEWEAVPSAESYDIEYAEQLRYFDGSDAVKSATGIEGTSYELTGLETGREWFFRLRSSNSVGKSPWCEPVSVRIGEPPSAPTTWSSSSTAVTGATVSLMWAHNAPDGSAQEYAEVEVTVAGDRQTYTKRDGETSHEVDTSGLTEGASIDWRVRTAGATREYGEWSAMRRVDVYAEPTLEVRVTDAEGDDLGELTAFPFRLSALAGPATQEPLGYHVEVVSLGSYTAVSQTGEESPVRPGDAVYESHVDTSDPLLIEFHPGIIDLEPGVDYSFRVTASMDSGLTAEGSVDLAVSWEDAGAEPDLEVSIDRATWTAALKPYVMAEDGSYLDGYLLSVYRREFDGALTPIAEGLRSDDGTVVTDPHPALDYARYRVVSVEESTGAVSYYDPPAMPVGCRAVVIQWDEEWEDFDSTDAGSPAEPLWEGSLIELPYNISVSDSADRDVEAVRYDGRRFPVSYYGTHVDSTSRWSVEFPRTDAETLHALRRLTAWMGDAYVREPTGTGYWAHIEVDVDRSYDSGAVSVSMDIERVEGGA